MDDLGIKVRDDKEEGEGKLLVSVWQESFPTIKQVDYNEQIEYNKQIASYWNGLRIVPLTLAVPLGWLVPTLWRVIHTVALQIWILNFVVCVPEVATTLI